MALGPRSVLGIGAASAGTRRGGGAREGVAPSRWGDLGGPHRKKFDFGGLRRCILKPSEDNFTAFSPARI